MQAGLFEQEMKEDTMISSLIHNLYRCGKLHKFSGDHIRKYYLDNNQPYTAILKPLREAQTVAVGICISLSKISLPRPLKTDQVDLFFNSNFKDEELVLQTDKEYVLRNLNELRNSYRKVGARAMSMKDYYHGPNQSMTMGKRESILYDAYGDILDCMFHIDELIQHIQNNDF